MTRWGVLWWSLDCGGRDDARKCPERRVDERGRGTTAISQHASFPACRKQLWRAGEIGSGCRTSDGPSIHWLGRKLRHGSGHGIDTITKHRQTTSTSIASSPKYTQLHMHLLRRGIQSSARARSWSGTGLVRRVQLERLNRAEHAGDTRQVMRSHSESSLPRLRTHSHARSHACIMQLLQLLCRPQAS